MSTDFEMIDSRRTAPKTNEEPIIIVPEKRDRMGDVIADNFGQILGLATDIIEIEKMKVQSAAILKQMEESRKNLLAEAEAYAIKKNVDTDSLIQKMQIVREMMRDFYQYNNNANLSGEDFSRIISSIVNEMGRL